MAERRDATGRDRTDLELDRPCHSAELSHARARLLGRFLMRRKVQGRQRSVMVRVQVAGTVAFVSEGRTIFANSSRAQCSSSIPVTDQTQSVSALGTPAIP